MHKTTRLCGAAILALVLGGCGSATFVRKEPAGGELRLRGSYMLAMGDARGQIVEHCDGRYAQTVRGDVVAFRCADAARAEARAEAQAR